MTAIIGRNDPCPCGSGNKFKKCCGSAALTEERLKALKAVGRNREIAYVGRIGKARESFCLEYTDYKKRSIQRMSDDQLRKADAEGSPISCHKGCAYCCCELIKASLQECEAIVYFLYHNSGILRAYLAAFPAWLEKAKAQGPLINEIGRHQQEWIQSRDEAALKKMVDAAAAYRQLQIPCPFLSDGICSIYEVRPFTCATVVATSPSENYNPANGLRARILSAEPDTDPMQVKFWDKRLKAAYELVMADAVYRILTVGYRYLSGFNGLQAVYDEVMADAQVKALTKSMGNG